VLDGRLVGIRNVLNPDKLAFARRQLATMSHVKPASRPVSR